MEIFVYDEELDKVIVYNKEYRIRENDILVIDTLDSGIDKATGTKIVQILGKVPSIKLKVPILNVKELMEYRKDQGISKDDLEIIKLIKNVYIWENQKISRATTIYDRSELGLWKYEMSNCLITGIGVSYEKEGD